MINIPAQESERANVPAPTASMPPYTTRGLYLVAVVFCLAAMLEFNSLGEPLLFMNALTKADALVSGLTFLISALGLLMRLDWARKLALAMLIIGFVTYLPWAWCDHFSPPPCSRDPIEAVYAIAGMRLLVSGRIIYFLTRPAVKRSFVEE